MIRSLFTTVALAAVVSAHYFPPPREGLTVIKSNVTEGVTISYKEVSTKRSLIFTYFDSIC